ncbi:NUDIX domain-containing protein [Conexibacter arvalis]|uniref:NUDIX domain-containing protein n=1 Tax=Conexibacter arvalis TaxID=912552 RepID=UPI00161B5EBD
MGAAEPRAGDRLSDGRRLRAVEESVDPPAERRTADIGDPASAAAAGPPHPPARPLARGAPAAAGGAPIPTIRPPAVGVSALVVRDGTILLGLRQGAHGAGTWAPPGGAVDGGEEPAATALRELEEETGLRGAAARPLVFTSDLFPADRQQWVTLHHLVDGAAGEPELREPRSCARWEWFPLDALPSPLFGPMASLVASDAWPPRA